MMTAVRRCRCCRVSKSAKMVTASGGNAPTVLSSCSGRKYGNQVGTGG